MLVYKDIVFVGVSCIFACMSGYGLSHVFLNYKDKAKRNASLHKVVGISDEVWSNRFACSGAAKKILQYTVKISHMFSFSSKNFGLSKKFIKSDKLTPKILQLSKRANMPAVFGNYAYKEVQIRLAFLFGCCGLVLGMIFSTLLAFILFCLGVLIGFMSVSWAMKQEQQIRGDQLEKNLPEMLEVISLGLRSGLTFDRSFELYCSHFSHSFSEECSMAQKKWMGGIKNREDALKDLSSVYDSTLFKRVIENINRSLRFGSSLVEGLEDAAREARDSYKTKQEEIVAKAPVKMMIPTGTLILPAMLILVLGPVLLELIKGF